MKLKLIIFFFLSCLFYSCDNQNKQKDLYRIRKNKKIGYIDSTGNEIIKPQYMAGSEFYDGLALIKVDTLIPDSLQNSYVTKYYKYGYVDKNNVFIIKPNLIYVNKGIFTLWEDILIFSEGLAPFRDQHTQKFGFINKKGEVAISAKFEWVSPFSDGLGLVVIKDENKSDKYGYIDHEGNFVIEAKYDVARDFSEGLAVVKYIKQLPTMYRVETMIINKKGNLVGKPFGFDGISTFSEGYAMETNAIFGAVRFINKNGEYVTDYLQSAGEFQEGFAPIKVNGKWGFCDTTFKLVIPAIYEDVNYFSNGIAPAKDAKWGYIDKYGNTVIQFKYDSCTAFDGSLAKIYFKRQDLKINGFINRKGEVVWQNETFYQNQEKK